ncbi:MAG: PhoP regulatory network YrbL family protein [Nanoarchaeota archaeon]|nr:PhoP regulatory network YrbL family protein [Nanoarchaeota archaeon]MBU1270197.1 PhoP regulatory network YrbL family protein [Nanoarchaeota archaeon]
MINALQLIQNIREENKIGEGTYRDIYQVSPDLCAKKIKSTHKKSYKIFSISYPTNTYTLIKFGIKNFNEYEYQEYLKIKDAIPNELANSFANIEGVVEDILFQKLVKDLSENISKPLTQKKRIDNSYFWNRINQLKEFFLDEKIYNFNVKPDNILIKELDSETFIPVITDYKRIGPRTYPFQPQLVFSDIAQKKIVRRFDRLILEYKY